MQYLLSLSDGLRTTVNPTWDEVERSLARVWSDDGCVTLDVQHPPEVGPALLQVRIDHQRAVIMFGVNTATDHDVRSYSSGRDPTYQVAILGDFWSDAGVCRQYDIVLQVFRQFFDVGDVSTELLS